MDFSLIQLEYLQAILKHGSFAKAAEACHVTQPTLSMQVKKLEEHWGVLLFDRKKKPVMATEIGTKLIDQAKAVLNEAHRMEEILQDHKEIAGTLKLGIIPTVAPYLVPRFLGKFSRAYPKVQLVIREMVSDEIEKALEAGELDLGLLATPLHKSSIKEYPLYYEPFLLYVNRKEGLYEYQPVNVVQIDQHRLWVLTEGNCFRNQVINLCDTGIEEEKRYSFESGSLETLIKMVDLEGGYTLIPALTALDIGAERSSSVKQVKHPVPVREISLVAGRTFARFALLEALKEFIREEVPSEMLESQGKRIEWKED